jgi:hypothetical protein
MPLHRSTTTVKADAVNWLTSKGALRNGAVYASKFYVPEKSWTRQSAWWFEIPRSAIEIPGANEIHLLCQVLPGAKDFHHLKVSVQFFREKLQKLVVRENSKVSLFLSAEPDELFIDQRGKGKVGFRHFLIS